MWEFRACIRRIPVICFKVAYWYFFVFWANTGIVIWPYSRTHPSRRMSTRGERSEAPSTERSEAVWNPLSFPPPRGALLVCTYQKKKTCFRVITIQVRHSSTSCWNIRKHWTRRKRSVLLHRPVCRLLGNVPSMCLHRLGHSMYFEQNTGIVIWPYSSMCEAAPQIVQCTSYTSTSPITVVSTRGWTTATAKNTKPVAR